VEGDEQPEPHEQAEEEPLQPQPAMLMILFLVEVVWLGCGELVLKTRACFDVEVGWVDC
jgi:hypothetical protein